MILRAFPTGLSVSGIVMSAEYGPWFGLLSALCLLVFATAWFRAVRKEVCHG